jgi:alpha-L-rhamnosidase
MLKVHDLKTEHLRNPLGLDAKAPRFSWKLESTENETVQTGFRLVVTDEAKAVWDSGSVKTDQSLYIEYGGEKLCPSTRYEVSLTVSDNHGESAVTKGWFETGLLNHENFMADWITHSHEDGLEPCAVFRKSFALSGNVKRARIYASALGLYEIALNGEKVGDSFFAPGWTNYNTRLQYQTYDITRSLDSNNTVEITVGNGWYKGILGFHGKGDYYGSRTAAIAQVEITYDTGVKEYIVTDENWECTTGPRRYSDIYNGETIDYSIDCFETDGVALYDHPKDILVGQENEPVRITERLKAKELIITPEGEVVIDFGQNMAGVVEVRLNQPRGTKVIINHAEALDQNGNLYTENLRTAKAADTFICSGNEDVFLPTFTFHGFRFIAVKGLGKDLDLDSFTGCVLHSDMEQTGKFSCDNDTVNQLWRNINWTMRANYLDVPTDCPQRDERMGYTGDAQIFVSTAVFQRDVAAFYRKYLRDLKTEQTLEFGVPMAVPNVIGTSPGIAIWHDAATVIPWTLWKAYGDKGVLYDQYESMKMCVEYTRGRVGENGLLQTGTQLGDWVALDMERGPFRVGKDEVITHTVRERSGSTDVYFIANAYYACSTRILADTASILGYADDAEEYEHLYNDIIGRFRSEYVTPAGRLVSETQTGCILTLQFNLVEERHRSQIMHTLLRNLQIHQDHLTTGFAGTQFICNVLSDNGEHDKAGTVFLQEDCPSWLYSVKLGATTVWERWDGVNPNGSFNRFEMNSLNQYGLASIGDWMCRKLGGLDAIAPGYKKSRIAPRLIKGITQIQTALETVYGELSCALQCRDGKYSAEICIPANTTAVVSLPEREEMTLGSGKYEFEYATGQNYEKEVYTRNSKFGELLEDPLGTKLLQQHAPELVQNETFLQFAPELSISEMASWIPAEVMNLLDTVLIELNKKTAG